jgi:hypothetical protein
MNEMRKKQDKEVMQLPRIDTLLSSRTMSKEGMDAWISTVKRPVYFLKKKSQHHSFETRNFQFHKIILFCSFAQHKSSPRLTTLSQGAQHATPCGQNVNDEADRRSGTHAAQTRS